MSLPRRLQIEFSQIVQAVMDDSGKEVTAGDIWGIFEREYLVGRRPFEYVAHHLVEDSTRSEVELSSEVVFDGVQRKLAGRGNGPIDAFVAAIAKLSGEQISVVDYHEHAIGAGAGAAAVTYIELRVGGDAGGKTLFGVGRDPNIVTASLKAIVSGLNRVLQKRQPSARAASAVEPAVGASADSPAAFEVTP